MIRNTGSSVVQMCRKVSCGLGVELLPTVYKAPGSIPTPAQKRREMGAVSAFLPLT